MWLPLWDSANKIIALFYFLCFCWLQVQETKATVSFHLSQVPRRYSLKQDSIIFFRSFSSMGFIINLALRFRGLATQSWLLSLSFCPRWRGHPEDDMLTHSCHSASHSMSWLLYSPLHPYPYTESTPPCPEQSLVCR